jgi:hypothetical protein
VHGPAFSREQIDPDNAEARGFLSLLDPGAHEFTFQTFDDNCRKSHNKNGLLARSTSDWAEILQLYQLGAGVYVTVNETDLTGRKSENITCIRAVFQEDDDRYGGRSPAVDPSPGHFPHRRSGYLRHAAGFGFPRRTSSLSWYLSVAYVRRRGRWALTE